MTTEMSVPLSRATPVLPGEEVDVAVEIVGPHGRRKFGQRVWCHVQFVDPNTNPASVPTEDELSLALVEIAKKKSVLDDEGNDEDGNDDNETNELTKAALDNVPPSTVVTDDMVAAPATTTPPPVAPVADV